MWGKRKASNFYKQHVVLLKTTRCFIENDTLFYWKRHVVFGKTIPLRGRIELSFFALCDTCDSKKVKSLLDARAYVRVKHPLPWETHLKTRKFGELSLWAKSASESEQCEVLARDVYSKSLCFAFFDLQNWWLFLGKVHFIAKFSLFAPISPHIQIEEQEMKNISYIEKKQVR